ncbi:AsmA family protein [Pseudoalteromonas fenneropenaei]|uniref:AsmA family protein n=1 Tax=Pseudoalteromonas fenneropenaei TaxID=1737459 RepID=A0ABV7CIK1_9GAMM
MNRGIKIAAGIGIIIVAGVVVIPSLIPTSTIVAKVSDEVTATTGRTLQINGDVTLSVLPSLKIELNDVHLSNMSSGSQANMVSMQQLALHVPWLSVFSGQVELDKFVIRDPEILLEKDKQGRANWQLLANPTPAENKAASNAPVKLPEGLDVSLGEVAIYGGKLTYLDASSGAKQELSNLDLTIQLPSLYQALQVKGEVTYRGERVSLESTVTTPAKAIEGQDFSIAQTVSSPFVNLEFSGDIAQQGAAINGKLNLKGDSLKALTQWQGITLEGQDEAFNAFAINGVMAFKGDVFNLTEFSAQLDKLAINGSSTITLSKVPHIKAQFDLGDLNLNPYLPEPVAKEAVKEQDEQAPQPIVWDDTKLDLSALKQLNADIKVSAKSLQAREIKLGENQFSLKLQNGVATLGLDKFNAYEGVGNGKVVVNAAQTPYQLTTAFSLKDINAQPLLTDAIGFSKVLGKGALSWSLTTQGQSQAEWVGALAGNMAFALQDGGVQGANLAEMVRKAQELLKGDISAMQKGLNADFNHEQTTDFSALTGTFNFVQGVGTNQDLMLASPLLRITGSGTIDLPKTQLDYRLVTGIVDTIEGQHSADTSTGFKIPVRLKGPFHAVKTSVDVSDAAKEQAKDKVKDKLKDKLKGLFGG